MLHRILPQITKDSTHGQRLIHDKSLEYPPPFPFLLPRCHISHLRPRSLPTFFISDSLRFVESRSLVLPSFLRALRVFFVSFVSSWAFVFMVYFFYLCCLPELASSVASQDEMSESLSMCRHCCFYVCNPLKKITSYPTLRWPHSFMKRTV